MASVKEVWGTAASGVARLRAVKAIGLSLCAIAVLPSASFGEEAKPSAPMSLAECAQTALRNNIDVITARNSAKSAEHSVTSAKGDYYPQVSIENNAFTISSGGVLGTTSNGTAVVVSQNIFDGGIREASVQSAKQGLKQSRYYLSRTEQDIVYSVSKAYFETLRARRLAEVAQSDVTYNEGLREQILLQAKVGEAADVDVLPIEAQLASSRVSLLSAENTVRTTMLDLQSVMGLSSQPGFDVQEVEGASTAEIGKLDDYMAQALKSRPDIGQYSAATGAARAAVSSARVSMYPRPVISAEYQRRIQGGLNEDGTQVVGGISFNLFDGGSARATYKSALISQQNAEAQERQVEKDIRLQVEEAYLTLTTAQAKVSASDLSLQSAQKNYDAQKEKYSQGLGTTLDLLNAESQLVSAQSDAVEARYDYYIAVAQMDHAVGK